MNKELAIEILKQATLETTTGACEKCPRKDKNKTCIGCLDEAKEKVLSEIERLNNIINKGIEAINVYQNEKTLSVGYQDLKRIRGILQGNEFDLQMFEEYLKELGEKNENE